MKKIYILDTSVLIDDPSAYNHFTDSMVIVPIAVVNELDKKKTSPGEVGKNARVCCKLLDNLCSLGDISTGVQLENNIVLKVDTYYYDLKEESYKGFGDPHYADTQILVVAYNTKLSHPDCVVTLVSNDINLRIKARSRGIDAQGHSVTKNLLKDLYSGEKVIVNEELGLDLQKNGMIDPNKYNLELYPHECILVEDDNHNGLAMARKVGVDKLKLIKKNYPWGISARNKEQTFAIELINDKNIDLVSLVGRAGSGKTLITCAAALDLVINKREYDKLVIYRPFKEVSGGLGYLPGPQPLDAKILTPTGWTTMGQLKVNDLVISRDGKPTKVLGVFPKGKKLVYKLTTTDKVSTECCEDHLWFTTTKQDRTNKKEGSIKSTKEIMESLVNNKNELNHYLPRNEIVQYENTEVPLPAYTFGAILGDGSLHDRVILYNTDKEIVEKVNSELLPLGYTLHKNGKMGYRVVSTLSGGNKVGRHIQVTNINDRIKTTYKSLVLAGKEFNVSPHTIYDRCSNNKTIDNYYFNFLNDNKYENQIKNAFFDLGLYQKVCDSKFIPDIYKYSSVENRIELLRGLMDTDGIIKDNGECSFSTTSKQLALDIIEVVKSLGGRAVLRSRDRVGKELCIKGQKAICTKISYEFNISLSNINPFYLPRKANRFNNKAISNIRIESIEPVGYKEVQCILVENPEHLYITDNFIVTHNTLEEKLAPWFQAVLDSFEFLFTMKNGGSANSWKKELELYQKKGRIELEAITYIRGRSIPNSIIILDECQNCSKEDIKTLLTRAGENTKVILTGDIDQIDDPSLDAMNNGLTYAVEKFKNHDLSGHITLTQGERSRLATLSSEIL